MPNLFERIAIGTANFGSEYNGVKVSEKDIEKILGFCQCSGIDTLDTATAYGWDWTQANSYFKKIVKVRKGDDIEKIAQTEPYCIMAHGAEHKDWLFYQLVDYGKLEGKWGLSDYEGRATHLEYDIIQIPYSLYDRRFEPYFAQWKEHDTEIYVRSIFLRGRILKEGIEPCECIKFCLCNPHIDKVIIGVDSFEQLQRNLDFLHRWKNLERHDEELLDTRKW